MAAFVRAILLTMVGLGPLISSILVDDAAAQNRAPFSLVDQTGQAVTDEDFLGNFLLIFFGYTSCPDICPTDLTVMSEAVELLGDAGDVVQPIFITIDPARDTVAVMSAYVTHFHPRLVGLTGTPEQVEAIGARYGIRAKRYEDEATSKSEQTDDNYFLDHTGAIYLIAPDGGGLTYFQHGVPAADIAATIQQFIDQAP
jgi:protein SCO1/2